MGSLHRKRYNKKRSVFIRNVRGYGEKSAIGEIVKTVKIFVLSDHLMFGLGLESLLNKNPHVQIVGQDRDSNQAVEKIDKLRPDIVIMDSSGTSSEQPGLKQLLKASPEMKVIGLSLNDNDLYIYQATQTTVTSVDDLLEAIDHATTAPPHNEV